MGLWDPISPVSLARPHLPSTLDLTDAVHITPILTESRAWRINWVAVSNAVKYTVYVSPSPFTKHKFVEVPRTRTYTELRPSVATPDDFTYFVWVSYEAPSGAEVFVQDEPVYSTINSAFVNNPLSAGTERDIIYNADSLFYIEEIRRRHLAMLEYDGEEFHLYIKRLYGQPCTCLEPTATGGLQRVIPSSTDDYTQLEQNFDPTIPSDQETAEAKDPEYRSPYRCQQCVVPGTLITMGNHTVKPIEDISLGDIVLTHTGQSKPVTKLFSNHHTGDLVLLNTSRGRLSVTADHPVWIIRQSSAFKAQKKINRQIMRTVFPEFIRAGDIKSGDCIVSVRNHVDKLHVDYRIARMIGYYASEGYADTRPPARGQYIHKRTRFFIGTHEMATVGKDIQDAADLMGVKIGIEKTGSDKCIALRSTSGKTYSLLSKHVPGQADTKYLSEWVMSLDDNSIGHILGSMLDGDGYCKKVQGHKWGASITCSIATSSKRLAYQLAILLERLGIPSNIHINKNRGGPTNRPHVSLIYCLRIPPRYAYKLAPYSHKVSSVIKAGSIPKDSMNVKFVGQYVIYIIRSVNRIPYVGPVMNMEVQDDNSYVADGMVVHNCYGTSVVGGYFPKISIKARYGNLPRRSYKFEEQGIEFVHNFNSWTTWHPKMKEGDFIVRVRSGERFLITEVGQSDLRGITMHQEFNTVVAPRTAIIYEVNDDAILQAVIDESAWDIAYWDWSLWA